MENYDEQNIYAENESAAEAGAAPEAVKKIKTPKKDNKLALAMAAIILAFIVFIVLCVVQDRIVNQGITSPVVVAVSEVPRGTVLTQENMADYFAVEQRDAEELPSGITFPNGIPLVGKVTARDIHPMEIITDSCFITEDFYDDVEDPVEVSIQLGDIGQAVGGILRAGDIIDIKVIVQVEKEENPAADTAGMEQVTAISIPNLPEPGIEETVLSDETIMLDGNGSVVMDEERNLTYGVTGEYASQTIAENVRITGVYTSGGEHSDVVEASGETMVATVINVVVPRSLQDAIYIAMEEGTIRLSKVISEE